MNILQYPAKPRKLLISITIFSGSHRITTSSLVGSTNTPSLDITCPKSFTSSNQN